MHGRWNGAGAEAELQHDGVPGGDPHVSEAGSPHARYAVLDINEERVSVDLIAIAYDWEAAVARAESNGRHDWANGLRTGWFIAGTRS